MRELPRPILAGLGIVGVVLLVGTSVIVLAYGQGHYDDGFRITATFPTSSQGLYTDGGSDVKVRGINVGTVDDIELLADGRARITLFLDPDVRIPATASASIEPLSVFGPKFVRVDPGDDELTGPFLAAGGEIARTATAVELTEVLDRATAVFQTIDPQELVSIIDAVSEGVDGLGPGIGASIDATAALVGIAHEHIPDTQRFLSDLAAITTAAADRSATFVTTVDDLRTLLPVIADHGDDLDALLDQTTTIAATAAGLFEDNRQELATTIEAFATLVHGVYGESARIPDLLDLVGTFFGRLSDVIRIPAPGGAQMAALRGFISLDLCTIYGVCP